MLCCLVLVRFVASFVWHTPFCFPKGFSHHPFSELDFVFFLLAFNTFAGHFARSVTRGDGEKENGDREKESETRTKTRAKTG